MLATVACDPPLGQPSTVQETHSEYADDPEYTVNFHVLILTAEHTTQRSLAVQVWHNLYCTSNADEWTALPLKPGKAGDSRNETSLLSSTTSQPKHAQWFSGAFRGRPADIDGKQRTSARFTVRFRQHDSTSGTGWKWATEHGSNEDGVLLYQPSGYQIPDTDIKTYLNMPNSSKLVILKRASETPYTLLWLLTASDVPAAGEESGWGTYSFGKVCSPLQNFCIDSGALSTTAAIPLHDLNIRIMTGRVVSDVIGSSLRLL